MTTTPSRDTIRETCAMIRQDMAEDVSRYDGSQLDGRVVGEIHGNLSAAVSALAGMIAALDEWIDDAIEQHREDAPHIYPDGSTS